LDNVVRNYIVGENEQFNYALLIDEHSAVGHQHLCFYLERNAVLVAEILIVRSDAHVTIDCVLRGQGAQATIAGAYSMHQSHKVQINTMQHHQAAHTRSTLVMRGVLRDSAHAQYHGLIRVDKDAHGSVASQENKNMLLSNNARAVSVPSLEVLTNDVQCFHGSATGRCDDEQLFYCATRGIDEKTAQQLLMHAFFAGLFKTKALNDQVYLLIE
jgi:Fe-S cluster assembly scaffold protein SufB